MLLLIDAGNTRIKWAVAEIPAIAGPSKPGEWAVHGVARHDVAMGLEMAWREWPIAQALISNVAGPAVKEQIAHLLGQAHPGIVPEWFTSGESRAGLFNAYRNPAQLGCDRFASAIGAYRLYPGEPLIVATCGTATTIDAIDDAGRFIGGMILPGLGLMAASLALNTAQLPQIGEQVDIVKPFADNTNDAIVSGCVAAQTGAIEHAAAAHQARYGQVRCILSGGAASMLAPHLSIPCIPVDNLVLIGLHAVAMESQSSC